MDWHRYSWRGYWDTIIEYFFEFPTDLDLARWADDGGPCP